MTSRAFRAFVGLFSILFLTLAASGASALPPVGCNVDVLNAMSAKAEAQVAYDVAVTRQLITQPESILDLTCFDQAVGTSAFQGGQVFGGTFANDIDNVFNDADVTPLPLSGGTLKRRLDKTMSDTNKYDCKELDNMWNSIVGAGISNQVPYASFDNLRYGTMPGPVPPPGPEYQKGWNAAKAAGVFNDLDVAMTKPFFNITAGFDFTNDKSSCDVLFTAGIFTGPCPPP